MTRFVILLSLWVNGYAYAQTKALDVVYPREGVLIGSNDSMFVFGCVKVAHQSLRINNMSTPTHEDGAFIQFLPITNVQKDSVFQMRFEIKTKDCTIVRYHRVRIPLLPRPMDSDIPQIDSLSLKPSRVYRLQSGDDIPIACRATPHASVEFTIIDTTGKIIDGPYPMAEYETDRMDDFPNAVYGEDRDTRPEPISGMYSATYRLCEGISYQRSRVAFRVEKKKKSVTSVARGFIDLWPKHERLVAELNGPYHQPRTMPGQSFYYFLQGGLRILIDGSIGSWRRLRFAENHSAWVSEDELTYAAPGTPVPASTIPVIRVRRDERTSVIKLTMSEKLPYRVEQISPVMFKLFVYGGKADTDWIRFETEDPDIAQIHWSQPERDVFCVTVSLHSPLSWGYEVRYENSNLVWRIYHKPKQTSLKGLRICIDPGHSKDPGSVGPRRTTEKQANVEIAQWLKELLIADGAEVLMTHEDTTKGLTLYERVQFADANNCDLFVSIHHNALPDGVNPLRSNFGHSVIYYHPHSRLLGEKILESLVNKVKLPNYGVFQGNIAVVRNSRMPAVLVENAFIMLPDQEKKIRDPKFQQTCAEAIRDGLRQFMK
ncbi:MAG TPA: N-acetylmuramoyl-L-alanine amidase [bacterium]|nr:N-acetylmuramoyl-L-alanine amidase [bacterium]HNB57976.1 N-acetylmuramoyl-L-alanine amidase [bacterium]